MFQFGYLTLVALSLGNAVPVIASADEVQRKLENTEAFRALWIPVMTDGELQEAQNTALLMGKYFLEV